MSKKTSSRKKWAHREFHTVDSKYEGKNLDLSIFALNRKKCLNNEDTKIYKLFIDKTKESKWGRDVQSFYFIFRYLKPHGKEFTETRHFF